MDCSLISPEKPGEFDGVSPELVTLIRQARAEKAERFQLDRDRVGITNNRVLMMIDKRLEELRWSRLELLHEIARRTEGFSWATFFALWLYPEIDMKRIYARYNKRSRLPDLSPNDMHYSFLLADNRILDITVNPKMWYEAANFTAVLTGHGFREHEKHH
jgi:hypothetical protein